MFGHPNQYLFGLTRGLPRRVQHDDFIDFPRAGEIDTSAHSNCADNSSAWNSTLRFRAINLETRAPPELPSARFVRTMVNPLYSKLYAIPYYPILSKPRLEVLKWRVSILTTIPPRAVWSRPGLNDYIVHTDASFDNPHGGMASAVSYPESYRADRAIRAIHVICPYDPDQINRIADIFRDSSPIFGLDLSAATVSIPHIRYFLTNRTIAIFVDNNAVLGALINGPSTV